MNETIDKTGLGEALRWSFVLCGTDRGRESREPQEGWDFCIVTWPSLSAWVNLSLFGRPFSSIDSKGNGEVTAADIACNREGNDAMTWSELSNNEMRASDKESATLWTQLTDLMAWCVWGVINLNTHDCEAIWKGDTLWLKRSDCDTLQHHAHQPFKIRNHTKQI